MKNISGVAVVFLGLLAIPKTITEEFHSQNLSNQGSNNNTEYASFLRPQPSQIAYWDVSPTVRVCPSSRITTSRIETAMSFWRSLGYTFDGLVMSNDSSNACTDNIHYFGEIIITLPDQNFDMSQIQMNYHKLLFYSGWIIDVEIPQEKMKFFLDQNKPLFNELVDKLYEKIVTF